MLRSLWYVIRQNIGQRWYFVEIFLIFEITIQKRKFPKKLQITWNFHALFERNLRIFLRSFNQFRLILSEIHNFEISEFVKFCRYRNLSFSFKNLKTLIQSYVIFVCHTSYLWLKKFRKSVNTIFIDVSTSVHLYFLSLCTFGHNSSINCSNLMKFSYVIGMNGV